MNITVLPHGRTGNRLFQYALGLLLARDKQCNFFAEPLPFFDSINYGTIYPIRHDALRTSSFGNNYYDYDILLNTDRDIIIDSYVQKADIFLKNRKYLQNIFNTKNTLTTQPEYDELTIHIRETDYKAANVNSYLGDNTYINIIKNSKFKKHTIVTDNIDSQLIKTLVQNYNCKIFTKQMSVDWRYPYFSKNELDDFNYIKHSKNIFLSQSTFSWWAAFLGNPDQIIFPYNLTTGMWKLNPGHDDIDLYFDTNASKFIY